MIRQTLLLAACAMMSASALAETVVFRGTLTREQCVDNGNPFDEGRCRKLSAGGDRSCEIAVKYKSERTLVAIQVTAAAFVNSGDRNDETISARLESPYLANQDGFGYLAKADSDTAIELMARGSDMAVTKANIYMNHEVRKEGGRTIRNFIQYSCRGLKANK